MVNRFDEKLPEGTIYACPICGREVLFNCYHKDYWGSVVSVQMSITRAKDLRKYSGYYKPDLFICIGCGEEKEIGPGVVLGDGATCKECVEGTNIPKIGNYKIPFDPYTGDQMYYHGIAREMIITEEQDWPIFSGNTSSPKWKDNYIFVDTLTLETQERGRSAAHFIFSGEDKKKYYMFLSEMVETVKRRGFQPGGVVRGRWTFAKRGQNYGIKPI